MHLLVLHALSSYYILKVSALIVNLSIIAYAIVVE